MSIPERCPKCAMSTAVAAIKVQSNLLTEGWKCRACWSLFDGAMHAGDPPDDRRPQEITPLTHRYVGMWRPPFEDARFEAHNKPHPECRCGADVTIEYRALMDHWLAGHFDVPQYEPKEPVQS